MGNTPSSTSTQTQAPNVWDPGRALMDLKAEQDLLTDTNEILLTEQRLLRAAPIAAEALVHLMQYSTNERVRLAAANSLLDRVMGKTDVGGITAGQAMNPIDRLLQACLVDSVTKGAALEVTSTDSTPTHGVHEFEPAPSTYAGEGDNN